MSGIAIIRAAADNSITLVLPNGTTAPVRDVFPTGFVVDVNGRGMDAVAARALFSSPKASVEMLQSVGAYMMGLLGGVGIALKQLLAEKPTTGASEPHLLTMLELATHEQRQLPWEVLFDGMRWLCARKTHTFARGPLDPDEDVEPLRWPLKALVVIGCDPADPRNENIGWEAERDAIDKVFARLRHAGDHITLEQPSRNEIVETVGWFRPHVIHFVGHGGDELECFDRTTRKPWPWKPTAIVADLQDATPRVVFLNACRTAEHVDGALSLEDAFRAAGAKAIIGMRGDVSGRGAAWLAHSFYEALARKLRLDVAVAETRARLERSGGTEFKLPSLSLFVRPERVLAFEAEPSRELEQVLANVNELKELSRFVDRRIERRTLRCLVDGQPQKPGPVSNLNRVLIVRGEHGHGKSTLLRWCLEHCARRGHLTANVDLRTVDNRDFVGVLHAILKALCARLPGASAHAPLYPGLDASLFATYVRNLPFLLRGETPPETPAPIGIGLGLAPKYLHTPAGEHTIENVFDAFKVALASATRGLEFVIALDELETIHEAPTGRYLRPFLFEPIERGALPNVRLLVAVTPAEEKELDMTSWGGALPIQIHPFKRAELPTLAREYLNVDPGSEVERRLDRLIQLLPDKDFPPDKLRRLEALFTLVSE